MLSGSIFGGLDPAKKGMIGNLLRALTQTRHISALFEKSREK